MTIIMWNTGWNGNVVTIFSGVTRMCSSSFNSLGSQGAVPGLGMTSATIAWPSTEMPYGSYVGTSG